MRQFPRIGIGNMSIQSALYYCAFILLLKYQPFARYINIAFAFLLILAILLTITNTGIATVGISSFLLLFSKKSRKIIIPVYLTGIVILVCIITKYRKELDFFINLLVNRLNELERLANKLFFIRHTGFVSSSLGFRERQIEYFLKNLTIYDIPFGSGSFTLSKNALEIIENFYFSLFHDFGISGLFILVFALFKPLKIALFDLLKNKDVMGITLLFGFCLYGITLSFVGNYSMSCLFMLTFYMIYFSHYGSYNK
jgi:hypothetical protein